ncbi:MAG: hypothetical protein HGB22_01590 [Chlorobiaceae bacterium]|nr:hypothetical protein [Chlorobiaceae bacterium]
MFKETSRCSFDNRPQSCTCWFLASARRHTLTRLRQRVYLAPECPGSIRIAQGIPTLSDTGFQTAGTRSPQF